MVGGQSIDDKPSDMYVSTFSRLGGTPSKCTKQAITILICRDYFVIAIVT